jgi:hypothetical protein
VYRGKLWYRLDVDEGAWYFRKGELEEQMEMGMAGLLPPTPQELADMEREESGAFSVVCVFLVLLCVVVACAMCCRVSLLMWCCAAPLFFPERAV